MDQKRKKVLFRSQKVTAVIIRANAFKTTQIQKEVVALLSVANDRSDAYLSVYEIVTAERRELRLNLQRSVLFVRIPFVPIMNRYRRTETIL